MSYCDAVKACFDAADGGVYDRVLFEPVFKHLVVLGGMLDEGQLDTTVLREFRQLLTWFIEFVSKGLDGKVVGEDLLRVDADAMVRSDLSADAEFEAVIKGFDVSG